MPLIAWGCGAECGAVSGGIVASSVTLHWRDVTGTWETSAITVRGGGLSYATQVFGQSARFRRNVDSTSTIVTSRFDLQWVKGVPTHDLLLLDSSLAAGSSARLLFRASDAKLCAVVSTATLAGPVLSENSFYDVRTWIDVGTGTRRIRLNVNGTEYGEASIAVAASTFQSLLYGVVSASTGTIVLDNIVYSHVSADYPLLPVEITGLGFVGDGTHNFPAGSFKVNDADTADPSQNTLYQAVDDPVLTGMGDFLSQNTISDTYVELVMGTVSRSTDPLAVVVVGSQHAQSTTANTCSMALVENQSSITVYQGVDVSDTVDLTFAERVFTTAPSGTSWTEAKSNAPLKIRWGYSTDVTPAPYLDGVRLEVIYPFTTPSSGGGGTPQWVGETRFLVPRAYPPRVRGDLWVETGSTKTTNPYLDTVEK